LTEFDLSLANHNKDEGIIWPTFSGEHWIGGTSLILTEGAHILQHFNKFEGVCEFKIVF